MPLKLIVFLRTLNIYNNILQLFSAIKFYLLDRIWDLLTKNLSFFNLIVQRTPNYNKYRISNPNVFLNQEIYFLSQKIAANMKRYLKNWKRKLRNVAFQSANQDSKQQLWNLLCARYISFEVRAKGSDVETFLSVMFHFTDSWTPNR